MRKAILCTILVLMYILLTSVCKITEEKSNTTVNVGYYKTIAYPVYKITGQSYEEYISKYYETVDFSPKTLHNYICLLGFEDPTFVYKQAIHESGWFKSNLYNKTNNLFGLHKAYKRKTTADYWIKADNGLYSGYKHWTKSVQDRRCYDYWLVNTYTNMDYKVAIITAKYCLNPTYTKNIDSIVLTQFRE